MYRRPHSAAPVAQRRRTPSPKRDKSPGRGNRGSVTAVPRAKHPLDVQRDNQFVVRAMRGDLESVRAAVARGIDVNVMHSVGHPVAAVSSCLYYYLCVWQRDTTGAGALTASDAPQRLVFRCALVVDYFLYFCLARCCVRATGAEEDSAARRGGQ